jgi:CheY-like chemotaxis protein
MTLTSVPAATTAAQWRSLTEAELAVRQLAALDAFHAARHAAEAAAAAAARSRELRMDAARRLEVLRREHDAVVARAHEQLRRTGELLRGALPPRVVLAHRNEWFVDRVRHVLLDRGFDVVAQVDNGADAVGVVVAEQPDVVLVEDTLTMVPGAQVVGELRSLSPQVLIAAQVAHSDRVGTLLDAGADTVFTRQMPPAQVASRMAALVGA